MLIGSSFPLRVDGDIVPEARCHAVWLFSYFSIIPRCRLSLTHTEGIISQHNRMSSVLPPFLDQEPFRDAHLDPPVLVLSTPHRLSSFTESDQRP